MLPADGAEARAFAEAGGAGVDVRAGDVAGAERSNSRRLKALDKVGHHDARGDRGEITMNLFGVLFRNLKETNVTMIKQWTGARKLFVNGTSSTLSSSLRCESAMGPRC